MFNKNHSKTSSSNIKYTFMVAAIASVLVLGTGYSSMQSFGTLGESGLLTGVTQSVECLATLTEVQQEALFQALDVNSIATASIALEEQSATASAQTLVEIGLPLDTAQSILGCLGVEIDLSIFNSTPTEPTEPTPTEPTSTDPTSLNQ